MYVENLKITTKRKEINCVPCQIVYEGKEQKKENYISPIKTANKEGDRSKPKVA